MLLYRKFVHLDLHEQNKFVPTIHAQYKLSIRQGEDQQSLWYPINYFHAGSVAPDSHFFKHMSLTTLEVVVIGLLVTVGLVVAILLLIFNIIWSSNK